MTAQGEAQIWNEEGSGKRESVRRMFGDIAPCYDRMNALICANLHHRWRRYAVRLLNLQDGETALDLCCGTGDFMPLLRRAVGPSGGVFGADFSAPMLAVAQKKGRKGLTLGDACQIPARNESIDAVSVGWGIRNVPDIDQAHREIVRVLKPGGRFVSIDTARPSNRAVRAVSELVFNLFVPALGALFGKREAYRYLPRSTQRFQSRAQLEDSMRRAGLEDVVHHDLLLGNVCIHSGRKPRRAQQP